MATQPAGRAKRARVSRFTVYRFTANLGMQELPEAGGLTVNRKTDELPLHHGQLSAQLDHLCHLVPRDSDRLA
jgi:hypothetical protein